MCTPKKIILAITVTIMASFTSSTSAFYGGVAQEVTQIISWALQYQQMAEEFQQLEETYRSLNGARGMEELVNNPEIRKYLPEDYAGVLQQGYGNWLELRQLLESTEGNKSIYDKTRDKLAIDEAMTQEAYRQASKRIQDIQVLLDKLKDTPDAKDIADLQGRIQAEQAMIQNERVKLSMLQSLQAIEARKLAEQTSIKLIESFDLDKKLDKLRSSRDTQYDGE